MPVFVASLISLVMLVVVGRPVHAEPWDVTLDIPLLSRWPDGSGKLIEQKVTGDLFRPRTHARIPAAVIINSSGGVQPANELYWARVLAEQGVAALVVDSFVPRGVRNTVQNQQSVWQSQSNVDAGAGFRWLAAQTWVDAARIMVLGMSRGGNAAIVNAVEMDRRRHHLDDIKFAAHVAIAPSCGFQMGNARTTGAPIFFMLAELDDYTPIAPCLEYSARMRAAGPSEVRLAVYPGVYHAFEWHGGVQQEAGAERYRACRFMRRDDGSWVDRVTEKEIPVRQLDEHVKRTCMDYGPVTVGGDWRVKQQATADLIQFLRDVGIIEDAKAREAVPDCGTVADPVLQHNCKRARAGWLGDMVALGRAYRYPSPLQGNPTLAARLFQLAAERGHPQAQWELGFMHWLGVGVDQDMAVALRLLRQAAEAGETAAMNLLGLAARDGRGRPNDDSEAVRWFQQAADLRHGYAIANLGRMIAKGRGGLTRDPVEAVRLYRKSVSYGNPSGQLALADALEKGVGVERNINEARALLEQAAHQDRDADMRKAALAALARLDAKR